MLMGRKESNQTNKQKINRFAQNFKFLANLITYFVNIMCNIY